MRSIIHIVIFTSVLMGCGAFSYAQVVPQPLSLIASPSSPSPGQHYAVLAATPTIDRYTATFIWTVNGTPRPDFSGIGKNEISLTAGSLGSETRIAVSVRHAKGTSSTSLIIRVSDLALTWFAETYVPPWYRGKALPTQNTVVNIVAMPHIIVGGTLIPPELLMYQWSFDSEADAYKGVDARVFRIRTLDLPGATHTVRVAVEDLKGRVRKEGLIIIAPTAPRIALYATTPLGGVEPRSARSSFSAQRGTLIDFQAEPFFFPVRSRRDLSYQWTVGGINVQGQPENPSLLTINTGTRQGKTSIRVSVDDKQEFIPSAAGLLNLLLQ